MKDTVVAMFIGIIGVVACVFEMYYMAFGGDIECALTMTGIAGTISLWMVITMKLLKWGEEA